MASCTGSTPTPVGACDGAGACKQTPGSCAPYLCGATACKTTCATNADCVDGYTCQGYSCTNLKPNGSACTAAAQCISGSCTEGYCCGVAACPSCNSCAVPGKQGTCAPIADGITCGAALCDGQDRLRLPPTCMAGQCVTPAARTDCTPYACDAAAGACKPSCASDADCAKKNKCSLADGGPGTCGP
jgi:hypothetical protein